MSDRHDVLDAGGAVAAVAEVDEVTGWVTFLPDGGQPEQFPSVGEFLARLDAVGGSCPGLVPS